MEVNIEGLLAESALQAGALVNRCLLLAGQNAALTLQVKTLQEENQKLQEQIVTKASVIPIK